MVIVDIYKHTDIGLVKDRSIEIDGYLSLNPPHGWSIAGISFLSPTLCHVYLMEETL